jgi:hypothetical protein
MAGYEPPQVDSPANQTMLDVEISSARRYGVDCEGNCSGILSRVAFL